MKVRVNNPGCLPVAIRGEGGPREFEIIPGGDPRRRESDRGEDPERYLLVMPPGVGHAASSTVDAWRVSKDSCSVLER